MSALFLGMGVGPGIGFTTALRFAKEGYRPVLVARDLQKLQPLADEIQRLTGQRAETVALDVSDTQQILSLAERYGSDVEVLHYNAAVLRAQRLNEQSVESLADDIFVNITGALTALKAFYPHFTSRQSGSILLTGGGLALSPSNEYLTLSVGKAGIRSIAQALFPELAAHNVHIATVTVAKGIAAGSQDAQAVGEAFWALHQQQPENWQWEAHYGG